LNHRRWKVLPPAPAGFLGEMRLPPVAVQLLYSRGITSPSEAEDFLRMDGGQQGDPLLLPEMERAVARVYQALLRGETIAVYGDFDADGICGTVVLAEGLSLLGGNVVPYIPHRVEEGYGLNCVSLDSLCQQGASLVVTVDCGVGNVREIEYAQSLGLDVIVTDHHSISHGLPKAFAVVNPKRADSVYPFPQLAGVGVAYKFLQALFVALGRKDPLDSMLDVVAIGTVADMVPLVGENRTLVKAGLRALSKTKRLGLIELMRTAGMQPDGVGSEQIAWTVAPRLNAPGRLEHAVAGYRLLVTDSPDEARQLAQVLEETNTRRQILTNELVARAKEELSGSWAELPLLMVGGEHYVSGVVGLVAGKLVEEFYRPSIVYETREKVSKGSARSIPEFDVVAALGQCRDLLVRFGGHPMAAGFTVENRNLPELHQRLLQIADAELSLSELQPSMTVEAELPLAGINGEVLKLIDKFAPFGTGNPVPVFLSRGAQVTECQAVGNGSRHLKLKLKQGKVVWRAIGFDLGHLLPEVGQEIDIVYSFSVDRWGAQDMLELNILDFAPVR